MSPFDGVDGTLTVSKSEAGPKGIRPYGFQTDVLSPRLFGSKQPWSDEPVFITYQIGRPVEGCSTIGNYLATSSMGCPYRCAHCWVANAALSADYRDNYIVGSILRFPAQFRDAVLSRDDLAHLSRLYAHIPDTNREMLALVSGFHDHFLKKPDRKAFLEEFNRCASGGIDTEDKNLRAVLAQHPSVEKYVLDHTTGLCIRTH